MKNNDEQKAFNSAIDWVVLSNIRGYRKYDRYEFQSFDEAVNQYRKFKKSLLYAVDKWKVAVPLSGGFIEDMERVGRN